MTAAIVAPVVAPIAQATFPRIVRAGSRYAVAFKQDDAGSVSILFLSPNTGAYDVLDRLEARSFKHEWSDVDEFTYPGTVRPTVEHYLDVVARSSLP